MTDRLNRIDPTGAALASWLADGPDRGPIDGLEAALAATRAVAQRPSWQFPSRWIPVDPISGRLDRRGIALVMALLTLTLLVLAALYVVVGSQKRLPPPFGPAANGVIAYDTGRGGGVWITDRDGSNARRVAGDGIERMPVFSPDGTLMAYWSRPPIGATQEEVLACAKPCLFHLYVANADGSNAHQVAGGQWFEADANVAPVWSPSAQSLAFALIDDGQLHVVDVNGTHKALTLTRGRGSHYEPAWSPDGKWIAFAEEFLPDRPTHAVAIVRPDGGGLRELFRMPFAQSPDTEATFAGHLTWSPDSKAFIFDRGRDVANADEPAYWAFLVEQPLVGPQRLLLSERSGWLGPMAYSPDGTRIAYASGEAYQQIRIVDRAGVRGSLIVGCQHQITAVRWSPDGRLLASGCPGDPQLLSSTADASTAPVVLPGDAQAIDIQRVAP